MASRVTALRRSAPYPLSAPGRTRGRAPFGRTDGCSGLGTYSSPKPARQNCNLAGAPAERTLHKLASPSTCKHPPALKQNRPASVTPNGFAFGALLGPKTRARSPEDEGRRLEDFAAHLDSRHSKAPINYRLYQGRRVQSGCAPQRHSLPESGSRRASGVGVDCTDYLQRAEIAGGEEGAV